MHSPARIRATAIGIVLAAVLTGCTAPPNPIASASPAAEESVEYSPEVLQLHDLIQAMEVKILGSLAELDALINEEATTCRLEAEQRAADQLSILTNTHLTALAGLLADESAGGEPALDDIRRATAALADFRVTVAENESVFIQCETEPSGESRSRIGGVEEASAVPSEEVNFEVAEYRRLKFEGQITVNNLTYVRPVNQCVLDLRIITEQFVIEAVRLRPQVQAMIAAENGSSGVDQAQFEAVKSKINDLIRQMAKIAYTMRHVCKIVGPE